MIRRNDGTFKLCPFKADELGAFVNPCIGSNCAAYDVIPAEYTLDGKPVDRCLMMQVTPFFISSNCCGPIPDFEEKENE